jgi:hypothetical protein
MKRRPYEELQAIIEQQGGQMVYEKAGHGQGGAWVVTLHGKAVVFSSNGAGFPPMDRLYVPKVKEPVHYRDYSNDLVVGARDKWLAMVGSASSEERRVSTADRQPTAPFHPAETMIIQPFEGASEYLERVKASRGLPERNMEDLVKELLVRLGHPPASVVFQIGHIDVLVRDGDGKPRFVIEVKTSLSSKADRNSALRQAFDYASRNGAPRVVITDADAYEIYDRQAGLDHASMMRAKFQLTAFREADATGLDILRP